LCTYHTHNTESQSVFVVWCSNGNNISVHHDQFFSIKIDSRVAGIRVDQFLSQYFPSVSRSCISASIREGFIKVDGSVRKNSYRLKSGETVSGTVAEHEEIEVLPEKVEFEIIFEDENILVLSKPPGIVVHPGSGNYSGTLVNGLVYHCQAIANVGDKLRPGIVHRLDKDTSGIMLAAKTELVQGKLVDLFKNREIEKSYLALLHGKMKEETGRLVAPIGRHPVNRKKMAVRLNSGRHAVSNWKVLEELAGSFSLVRITIETGRTHQIRVHMAHLGNPVVGDRVYGGNRDNASYPRQLLHAHRLIFQHPVTKEKVDHIAPLWEDFAAVLQRLGYQQQGSMI
jgi:23S rRNA pseudouridine1911/1915/1917 synthase